MRKYFQVFSLGFKKTMRYPANFFLGLISIIAVFFMHFFMWRSLYASSNGDPIFGYEYSEMILYMALSGIIASVISSGFAWEIHSDIKEGGLARYIARPVNYAAYQFSSYIGERTGYITFSIVLIVIVYVIGNLSVLSAEHFIRFLIFLFVLTNAFILNFFIYYAVSGIGFWMRESTGIIHITGMLGTIISGGVFPLDIFSKPIQMLLNGLPFSYTNYFSISVLLGKIKGIELLHGILLQWLWIGICALLARIIWSRGMKKYAAVGNQWQVLMFIGSYTFLTGFVDAVFLQNITAFSEYVWKGTLDTYLTKPMNPLFMITTRKFDLGLGVPNFIGGSVMILLAWSKCNIPVTFSNIAEFIFFTLIGCLLSYPIMFIPTMLSFWLVKMDALSEITWAIWDINKMPMMIYTHPIRIFGTFILPIFTVTHCAPMWVMGILPVSHMIYAILAIPLFYGILFLMWKKALKHYSGASC